jgi:hypothetical protein
MEIGGDIHVLTSRLEEPPARLGLRHRELATAARRT